MFPSPLTHRPPRLRATRRTGGSILGSAVGRDPGEVDHPGSEGEVAAVVEEAGKGEHRLILFVFIFCTFSFCLMVQSVMERLR